MIGVKTTLESSCHMVQHCGITDEAKRFTVFLYVGGIIRPLCKETSVIVFELASFLECHRTMAIGACQGSAGLMEVRHDSVSGQH